jgi:hypothetical protein
MTADEFKKALEAMTSEERASFKRKLAAAMISPKKNCRIDYSRLDSAEGDNDGEV